MKVFCPAYIELDSPDACGDNRVERGDRILSYLLIVVFPSMGNELALLESLPGQPLSWHCPKPIVGELLGIRLKVMG